MVILYFYWTALSRERACISLHHRVDFWGCIAWLLVHSGHVISDIPRTLLYQYAAKKRMHILGHSGALWPGFLSLAFPSEVRVDSGAYMKRKVYLYSSSTNCCFVLLTCFCSLMFGSLVGAFHPSGVAKVTNCTTHCRWRYAITACGFTFLSL